MRRDYARTVLLGFLICCIVFVILTDPCTLSIAETSHTTHTVAVAEEATDATTATQFKWEADFLEDYPLPKQIRYTLSIQNLENRFGKNVRLWMYAPVYKTSYQALKNLRVSALTTVSEDKEGNIICAFSIPEIAPYETKIYRFWADLGLNKTPNALPLDTEEKYLQPERLIESDHPLIQEKSTKLQKGDPYQTAKSIYSWVADNVKSTGFLGEDKGALYALTNKDGDCTEYATLFVALCRAANIPARMVCGYICERNCIVSAVDFHNWAEFYHNGAWHLADPHNRVFDQQGENYIATEIYAGEHENPIGKYHRYRCEGGGVRVRIKM